MEWFLVYQRFRERHRVPPLYLGFNGDAACESMKFPQT